MVSVGLTEDLPLPKIVQLHNFPLIHSLILIRCLHEECNWTIKIKQVYWLYQLKPTESDKKKTYYLVQEYKLFYSLELLKSTRIDVYILTIHINITKYRDTSKIIQSFIQKTEAGEV